jgi:uncharacterized protein YhaN
MGLRILRLGMNPWGCFEDVALTFSPALGTVELIEGPNAAGKSTTSRAERALLYGIPHLTGDAHTHEYADLRIAAELDLDGVDAEVVRRKAKAGSLLDAAGRTLAHDPIPAALGGLTEDVYRALFQVSHDTLVQGGRELLEGKGEIGASLFAAAAGIATLHATLATLDAEASDIFRPRGHADLLHREVARLREAEKRWRDALIRPATYRQLEANLQDARTLCGRHSAEIHELEAEIRDLERRRATAPFFDRYEALIGECRLLEVVPELPLDTMERRVKAQAVVSTGATDRQRAVGSRDALAAQLDHIVVDDAVLDHAGAIRVAHDEVSAVTKAATDRRKLEGQRQAAEAALNAAAASIGVAPDEVVSLRRSDTERRALDDFIRGHGEIEERRRNVGKRLQDAQRQRDADHDDLERFVATDRIDVRSLAAAVRSASRMLALPDERARARAESDRLSREAAAGLSRLDPAPGDLGALLALPTPRRDAVARILAAREELTRDGGQLGQEIRRLDAAEIELNAEREQIREEGAVPSAHALAAARSRRWERWTKLRGTTESGIPLDRADADEFEESISAADQLADARTAGAAQIERTAAVNTRAEHLTAERQNADRDAAAIRTRDADLAAEWTAMWSVTKLEPLPVEQASEWLDERDHVVALAREADKNAAEAQALDEQVRAHTQTLTVCLTETGRPVAAIFGLGELIELADSELAEERDAASRGTALQAALDASERAVIAAKRDVEDTAVDWDEWQRDWPDRRAASGLPPTARPRSAHETLRIIQEALAQSDRIADLTRRLDGIDRDREAFDEGVHELCQALAPDLVAVASERATIKLAGRLSDAQQLKTERERVVERLRDAQAEVERIDGEVERATASLAELCALADCATADELAVIEQKAARRTALQHEIGELERRIAEVGEGPFAELRAAYELFDREAARTRIDEAAAAVESLTHDRDAALESIWANERKVTAAREEMSAIVAAQDVELIQARVQELAVRCARAKLSAAIIRRAIERYRDLHQDPLLRRANQLFTRFTQDTYVELFVDVNEKNVGYMVARRNDRVLHEMDQMSTGTREQLFLALRIAAIERYVELTGPVPVIFDDVFLESDEERSERIFEALGDLAGKTQVIVLTHHHHLVAVGQRALGQRLRVQELPGPGIGLRAAIAA